MKVLVTGGAGYVGTVSIRRLISSGFRVRCFDRNPIDLSGPLTEEQRGRYEFVTGDIRDAEQVKKSLIGVDAVLHLAAVVGSPACDADPPAATSINIDGTRVVAQAAPRGVPLIHLSTCSVYGRVEKDICHEHDRVFPLTLYGTTKRSSEEIVMEREGIVLRATTAYGASPQFRWDLIIHSFVRLALTTGRLRLFEPHAIRPFIHVDDIAVALIFAVEHSSRMAGQVYNIGSHDSTLTKLDLARRIAALTGVAFEIDETGRDPDGRHYRVAFDRIREIGYSVGKSFDSGLIDTVEWIRNRFQQEGTT